jgi:hypothetical protein
MLFESIQQFNLYIFINKRNNNYETVNKKMIDGSIRPSKLINHINQLKSNINELITNSVQVNVVNLVKDNSSNQVEIHHNQYEKCFENTF